ncbi:chorismate mutase [mine drainage metagenome]|uniref:Chorismate mutase n=1 Tax=mine drainage metagenome TaxID=410659 RepID=A0A1J5R137_9ZZZZ
MTPEQFDTAPTVPTRPDDTELPAELVRLRGSIDNIDAALVFLLAERFKATQQVGVLKAARGLPPSDLGREARQVARLRELAREAELDPVFAEKFLAFIVDEVIRHHVAIASEHTPGG